MTFDLAWHDGKHTVEYWLKRSAQKNLADTAWGVAAGTPYMAQRIHDDPLLKMVYMIDLGTFLHGEEIALYACSASINFAPDARCRAFLATQVLDEARHYEVFDKRLDDIGMSGREKDILLERCMTPSVKRFHDLVKEQIDKADIVASTIALNLILEGMAYPIYQYEIKYWSRLDPGLSEVIRGAFQDEVQHVAFGEALTRTMVSQSTSSRNKAARLVHDFSVIVAEIFDESRKSYVRLYQEAAKPYRDLIGDLEIFPGVKMNDATADDQARMLKESTQREFARRLARVGL